MRNLLLIQPKGILQKLYPKALWKVKTDNKEIYLTFDDGPVPELTDWVLSTLKIYNAKATFFCVGSNILKHNQIFERIKKEGHTVANHTMYHTKGFSTTVADYMSEVAQCKDLIENNLFRPPYGKLKRSQYKALQKNNFKVVFWDVISYDYEKISPQQCLNNVVKNTKRGSIVLFHDNVKAEENIKFALPNFLEYYTKLNYTFKALPT